MIYGSKTDRSGVISNYGILSFLFKGKSTTDSNASSKNEISEEIINSDAEVVVPLLGEEKVTRNPCRDCLLFCKKQKTKRC